MLNHRRNDRGASAVEYAMIAASVGAMLVMALVFFGTLKTVFVQQNSKIESCSGCTPPPSPTP